MLIRAPFKKKSYKKGKNIVSYCCEFLTVPYLKPLCYNVLGCFSNSLRYVNSKI